MYFNKINGFLSLILIISKRKQRTIMNPRALSQLLWKRSTFSSVNVRITGGLEAPLIGGSKLKDVV